jgi:hypothetical protein
MRCDAIKNKKSTEQCKASAVFGSRFCGRHVKTKNVKLWKEVNARKLAPITRFQSIFRGWVIRNRLKLAGKGVLNRKDVINDEDPVTFLEKNKIHPLEYFSFEDNGKLWCFEFSSIWTWCRKSFKPTNPYTKNPLSGDTRKRLREMWGFRIRNRIPLPEESKIYEERIDERWNIICQAFVDNGFVDIHPRMFAGMRTLEMYRVFRMLHDDFGGRNAGPVTRALFVMCNTNFRCFRTGAPIQYLMYSIYTLMKMVTLPRDPYITIFWILSALYRA